MTPSAIPVLPPDATREDWLAARREGITSTDAAALAGVSPWAGPLDVYLDKRGLLPDRASPQMRWGLRLEGVIATAYEETTGRTLQTPPPLLAHGDCPWIRASLDRLSDCGRVVELKTARTAQGWGDAGSDDVPESYLLQVQHQLLVTGLDVADLAVLIGGSDFRIYTVQRHRDLIARLHTIEATFWDRHLDNQPPEPDWRHPDTPKLLAALHGCDGSEIDLGADASILAAQYERIGQEIRELERDRSLIKSNLLAAMGPAAKATLPDGTTLHRRACRRGEYVVKPSEYLRFTIRNPKEPNE